MEISSELQLSPDEISVLLLASSLDDSEPVLLSVVADIHLAPPGAPPARWHNEYDFAGVRERLRMARASLIGSSARDLFVLGDITHVGDQASADEVAQILDVGDAVGVGRSGQP